MSGLPDPSLQGPSTRQSDVVVLAVGPAPQGSPQSRRRETIEIPAASCSPQGEGEDRTA